jgi:type I restriction-modification system DNA methylase subunit
MATASLAPTTSSTRDAGSADIEQIIASFQRAVIDRVEIAVGSQLCDYQSYLARPTADRSNDEANAVDQQFARYTLEWLGFSPGDWTYNAPQAGQKANRPDYLVRASIGTAFIWEDKNSTLDLDDEHLKQMRRYAVGTAGYAVWCNMRRLYAIRFYSSDTLKYEVLADIDIDQLFGSQSLIPYFRSVQGNRLALLRILFGKPRFTQFESLVRKVAVKESTFKQQAIPLVSSQALQGFIEGSRQSLDHLRLAALAQIQGSLESQDRVIGEEQRLFDEWEEAADHLAQRLGFEALQAPVAEAIARLALRLGELKAQELGEVERTISGVLGALPLSLRSTLDTWVERALRINNAILTLRFGTSSSSRVADAYKVWGELQTDQQDVKPEVFSEQVAYVFFIRLLLVRVLEDKQVLRPRMASDGGFLRWNLYVRRHFAELSEIGVLSESYCSLLTQKAGHFYLHFFQQAVFDWFVPDDFLLVETLEFLSRYNFEQVTSDIIGFTYEEYIDRRARNKKGHFLTRGEVVDYMLDLLGYSGPNIIGRRVLDPACGSGSFLVHAARRYRQALVTTFCVQHGVADEATLNAHPGLRTELANRFLDDLSSLFFGMELNPFSSRVSTR